MKKLLLCALVTTAISIVASGLYFSFINTSAVVLMLVLATFLGLTIGGAWKDSAEICIGAAVAILALTVLLLLWPFSPWCLQLSRLARAILPLPN